LSCQEGTAALSSVKPTELLPVITEEQKVDLSKAAYNENLSFTDLEEESNTFSVSIDRVLFKKLIEVAHTVLNAGGYLINLENTLAVLDSLVIGTRVKLATKDLGSECPVVKHHIPTLQMKLPTKNRIGTLLGLFYDEIKSYEAEIARLSGTVKKGDSQKQDSAELTKENKKLVQENEDLKAQLELLLQKNACYEKLNKDASRALAEQNMLAPSLRNAVVKEVNIKDRMIHLKSGRTSFMFPLALTTTIPVIGENCLVKIVDGNIRGAFFYEGQGGTMQPRLAEVIYVKDGICKIRDGNRYEYIQKAANEAERLVINTFKRGHKILAYFYEHELIRFSAIETVTQDIYAEKIQEAIVSQQLAGIYFDELAKQTEADEKDNHS
jgi:hypothetical protein